MSFHAATDAQADAGLQCPNCFAPASERFCGHCGQKQSPLQLSVWALVQDHLQGAFSVDGRLLRTLRFLFARPGMVARHYLSGCRKSYTHPVRLYLVVSALYFAIYLLTRPIDRAFFGFPDAADSGYASAMARGLLLSFPVLAIVMKALYDRRRWFLVEHVVFLFYAGAAGLLGAGLSLLLATAYKLLWKSVESAPFNPGWFHLAVFAGFGAYLVLSLRNAYAEPLLRSLWKAALLLLLLVFLASAMPTLLRWIF